MGLLSDGGVHSSLDHLFKLLRYFEKSTGSTRRSYTVYGRAIPTRAAERDFVEKLQGHLEAFGGKIARSSASLLCDGPRQALGTGQGKPYDLIVKGVGEKATGRRRRRAEILRRRGDRRIYRRSSALTDRAIRSVRSRTGRGDLLHFPATTGRRSLTVVLTQEDKLDYDMKSLSLYHCCMTLTTRQVHRPAHPFRQRQQANTIRNMYRRRASVSCASPKRRNTRT